VFNQIEFQGDSEAVGLFILFVFCLWGSFYDALSTSHSVGIAGWYRVIHEVLLPLREGIPEVIWNKKC
jgi:hypothetical protein